MHDLRPPNSSMVISESSLRYPPMGISDLRANVVMHQTNSGMSPKFVFSPTFIFCSPICPNNCGVVFWWKYILVFEKWSFSFDRSNMQIFIVNITRVVWPRVTNVLDLRYFCEHSPLFYHLNLIPCRYWSWKRNIYFLVNIFCPTYFSYVEK